MGSNLVGVHLRDVPLARTLGLARDALCAEGWTVTGKQTAGSTALAAAQSGGWTSIHLPRRWRWSAIDKLIAESGAAGLVLFVDDSDSWGAALFRDGAIVYRFDTRKRAPGARTVRKHLHDVLGLDVAEAALKQVLASRPTYAEEAMDAFARLLALDSALELPETGTTTLWATPPLSPEQQRLAGLLDVRAHALVREPPVGFGAAVGELVRLLADRAGGGQLGPQARVVARAQVTSFTERDLGAIAARLDAGEIDSVDVNFDAVAFRCYRLGTRGRVLQIVASELLASDGTRTRDDAIGLLDPDATLIDRLFVQPGVTSGLIDVVPADATRAGAELQALTAWPPVAHWIVYVDAMNAAKLGGAAAVANIAGWSATALANGGLLVRMNRPPHASRDQAGSVERDALTRALAALA